jgi:hypothetical protein
VNDGEIGDQTEIFEVTQPLLVVLGQLRARPAHGLGGMRVETFKVGIQRTILVMIALHAGHSHAADDVEALLGVGVVAHDIAQAAIMRDALFLGVIQNDFQRLEIGVNVSDDRELHLFASFRCSVCYHKSPVFTGGRFPTGLLLPDEAAQARFPDGVLKCGQFIPVALGHQFHPPVREVPDRSRHFKTHGCLAHRVAEPNALHPARIVNVQSAPPHNRHLTPAPNPAGVLVRR